MGKATKYAKLPGVFPSAVTSNIQKCRIRKRPVEELGLHVAAGVQNGVKRRW